MLTGHCMADICGGRRIRLTNSSGTFRFPSEWVRKDILRRFRHDPVIHSLGSGGAALIFVLDIICKPKTPGSIQNFIQTDKRCGEYSDVMHLRCLNTLTSNPQNEIDQRIYKIIVLLAPEAK